MNILRKLIHDLKSNDTSGKAQIRILNYLMIIAITFGFLIANQATRNPSQSAFAAIMNLAFCPIWIASGNNNNNCTAPDIIAGTTTIYTCSNISVSFSTEFEWTQWAWSVSPSDKFSVTNYSGWSQTVSFTGSETTTGTLRLYNINNSGCCKTISITGKPFARPGSYDTSGLAQKWVSVGCRYNYNTTDYESGIDSDEMAVTYSSSSDICQAVSDKRKVRVECDVSWSYYMYRDGPCATMGYSPWVALGYRTRLGDSGPFTSGNYSFAFVNYQCPASISLSSGDLSLSFTFFYGQTGDKSDSGSNSDIPASYQAEADDNHSPNQSLPCSVTGYVEAAAQADCNSNTQVFPMVCSGSLANNLGTVNCVEGDWLWKSN